MTHNRPTMPLRLLLSLTLVACLFFAPQPSYSAPLERPLQTSSLKGDSFSASPLGYKSALRFAQDLGYNAQVVRDPRGKRFHAKDTVLLFDPTIRQGMSREARAALEHYLDSEATLVISLPKRFAARMDVTGTQLLETGLLYSHELRYLFTSLDFYGDAVLLETPYPAHLSELRPEAESLQVLRGELEPWEVLIGDADHAILLRRTRANGAPIYLLSDSDLVANVGIARGDNAAIYQSLLRQTARADGQLYVDEAFHGYLSNYSPLTAATRFPGSLLSVQILLLALFLLWRAATHLRLKRPTEVVVEDGNRSLAESVGELLSEHQPATQSLRRFRTLVVQSALERSGGHHGLSDSARLAQLESLRSPTQRLAELDQELDALPKRPHTQRILRLARSYQRWFSEVIDGTP